MRKILTFLFLSFYIVAFCANITFRVDMKSQIVSGEGVLVAGLFNGWDGSNDKLTDNDNDGIYEITKNITAGNYEYEFKNGFVGWEGLEPKRVVFVPDDINANIILPVVCFQNNCSPLININATSNSAAIYHQNNFPIDIKFNGTDYSNISANPFILANLASCTVYSVDIKFSSETTYRTYYFSTLQSDNSPVNLPYIPVGTTDTSADNGFCVVGWKHNTDFQWFRKGDDGIAPNSFSIGKSQNQAYANTVRSSVTTRGVNLIAGQTIYIKYRPAIFLGQGETTNSKFVKTSIGKNSETDSQEVINYIGFSQIPNYSMPISTIPQVVIPYTPTSTGVYYISVYTDDITAFFGTFIQFHDFLISDSLLNVTDLEKSKKILIYPNPVENTLNIKTENKLQKVEIYSINGQLIKTSFQNETNVSELPKGNYVIKITTDKGVQTEKFIKE